MSLRSPLARLALAAASGALLTTAVVAPAVAGDHQDGTAAAAPGATPAGTPQPASGEPDASKPSAGTGTAAPGTPSAAPGTPGAAPGTTTAPPSAQPTPSAQPSPSAAEAGQPSAQGKGQTTTAAEAPLPGTGAQDPTFYRGRVTARGGLALRSGPDRKSTVVRVVPQGHEVWIHCKTNGEEVDGNRLWYLLVDGTWAWGSARYIENVGPAPRWC
jgi:hypothetical protein